MHLGERIRALRKERGLTLKDLAQRSGVAIGSLSRIERGKGSGNARTIEKIAEAFQIGVAELYRSVELPEERTTYLKPEPPSAQSFTYDEKATAILLTTQISKKRMLPQMIVLYPGGKTAKEQYPKGTERWLLGLEGEAEVEVGEARYRLSPGSTLYLDASLAHRLKNSDRRVAKIISVTHPAIL